MNNELGDVQNNPENEQGELQRRSKAILIGTEALYDIAAHNFPEMTDDIRSRYHAIAYKKAEGEDDVQAQIGIGNELMAVIEQYPTDEYPEQVGEVIEYSRTRWEKALQDAGE